MGNIEISRTVFPSGTRGGNEEISSCLKWRAGTFPGFTTRELCSSTCHHFEVDIFLYLLCLSPGVNMEMLGRRALWEVGLNYGHGTGHGVGNYFGVHECMVPIYNKFFQLKQKSTLWKLNSVHQGLKKQHDYDFTSNWTSLHCGADTLEWENEQDVKEMTCLKALILLDKKELKIIY